MPLIDFNFNIQPQALAVGHLLNGWGGIESSWDGNRYLAKIETAPWYNGRERGLVMVLSDRLWQCQKVCVAVVYEHRNSDSVCVVNWESEHGYLNPPTLNDIPEGTYKDKWDTSASFKYPGCQQAADYIYNIFEKFCEANFKTKTA